MDVADELGARQVEDVRIAGDVELVRGEPLAGVVLGREAGAVDHRPQAPSSTRIRSCASFVISAATSRFAIRTSVPKEDAARVAGKAL